MIYLPLVLFLIGNIGYSLYDNDPVFWFRNTNDRINDDLVMLISVLVAFVGFISSVIVYGDMLIVNK